MNKQVLILLSMVLCIGLINGATFTAVSNDPLQTRIYTLDNGLTVFLTKNKTKPTIHSFIAVKAGSSYDPADNTGLAHYLEHMLFKGTSKYGSIDYAREKIFLDRITALYELHKKEPDVAKKKEIYHLIDSISQIASTFAIPNEYDKMMSSIGAKDVNAFTSFDQTVYTEEIPANQLEKWAAIESERFRELVLRLFHTELEAVYEEFNIGQDDDGNQAYDQLMNGLFPQHPYGTQTTIGLGSHLKNPSMLAIEKYFRKYYVPNNMAICLSGDIEFEPTMMLIEKYFGTWKRSDQLRDTIMPIQTIRKSEEREVFGPKEEYVLMGFGMPRLNDKESMLLRVVDAILANQKAGLIDLNLVQQQKVLNALSMYFVQKDAAVLVMQGNPREGQSLSEVKKLLIEQINNLKTGKFDDGLVKAAIKFLKLRKMKDYENNNQRVMDYMDVFTRLQSYDAYVKSWNEVDAFTKKDVMDFANKYFTYDVTVYKKHGEPKGIVKVEKPTITPIQTNREQESTFVKELAQKQSPAIQPTFLDYNKDIQEVKLKNGINLQFVKNEVNPTFNLYYVLDMGKFNDLLLPIAIDYLPYLGTNKMSAEQLQMEFFRLGVSMDVSCTNDKITISLSGLEESVEPAVKLLEDLMKNVQADEQSWQQLKEGILKEREDEKLKKEVIFWRKLASYVQYGPSNPENNVLTNTALKSLKADELVNKLKALFKYRHRVFYYGQKSLGEVKTLLENNHQVNAMLLNYPAKKEFTQVDITKNQVFLVNYNMVQTEIGMLAMDVKYDPQLAPPASLFNEYFGGNMGSVVFQEIRESKALAYSTFSAYVQGKEKERKNYVMAYVGTQADKMKMAIDAMQGLLNNMPFTENLFNLSKAGILKSIASERIIGVEIFNNLENAKKLGLKEDIRKQVYAFVQHATFNDIKQFYQSHVQNKKYIYSILGNMENIDRKSLSQYGEVSDIAIDKLFGY